MQDSVSGFVPGLAAMTLADQLARALLAAGILSRGQIKDAYEKAIQMHESAASETSTSVNADAAYILRKHCSDI